MKNFRAAGFCLTTAIMIFTFACDENGTGLVGNSGDIIGTWELNALAVDYSRVVGLPATYPADTTFSFSAYWKLAEQVLGSAASLADFELIAFGDGDTVLAADLSFDSATLVANQISLEATFFEDGTYTITGAYPALLLDAANCSTYQAIPQITDAGNYTASYNMDSSVVTIGISPSELLGNQVLPTFDDGLIEFSDGGNTMQFSFTDRDGHDERIGETGLTWNEEEHRVIMGLAQAPYISLLGIFSDPASADTVANEAFVFEPSRLFHWSGYLTYNAMIFFAETYSLTVAGIIADANSSGTTVDEATAYLIANRANGATAVTQIAYSSLITDAGLFINDGAVVFDPANPSAGGKLTYVIKAVCIPVNELVVFDATFHRTSN